VFLQENEIETVAQLSDKVTQIRGNFNSVRDKIKANERRLKTLDEHIRQSENYRKYRGCRAKYNKLYSEYTTLKKAVGLFAEKKA